MWMALSLDRKERKKMTNFPKIPFSEAAASLAKICNQIDNAEPCNELETDSQIDELLEKEFSDALTAVTESIDRRKAFYAELLSKIDLAKTFRDKVDNEIDKYIKIKERLIAYTKHIVEAYPDIPFKDSFGKQLKVIDNASPKLVFDQDLGAQLINSVAVLDALPYVKQINIIDNELLKKDLLAGKQVPFAHLEYGKQLRGMK